MNLSILKSRYGKKLDKLFTYISNNYPRKSEYVSGFSGISISQSVWNSMFSTLYKPSRNNLGDISGFIIRDADTNKYYSHLIKSDSKISILSELLYLGILERDVYKVGEKSYYYRIKNQQLLNEILLQYEDIQENSVIEEKIIIDNEIENNITLNSNVDNNKLNIEYNKPLINSVYSVLSYLPIPDFKYRKGLDNQTRLNLLGKNNIIRNIEDKNLYIKTKFSLSYTGRLFQIDSSFRPASSILSKHKGNYYDVLSNNLNTSYKNYDIQSSQLVILKKLCEDVGMKNYEGTIDNVANKKYQLELSEALGLSTNTVKVILLSLLFGADLTRSPNIIKMIRNDVGYDKAWTILQSLRYEFISFINLLDNLKVVLLRWLHNTNPTYIENGVTKIKFSDIIKNKIDINKILVFYLQGMESFYIYNTIVELKKYKDVRVISYEFDGLVVLGKIPPEVKTAVNKICGFKVNLIEKKF